MSRGPGSLMPGNARRGACKSKTRNIKARGQPRPREQKGVLKQSISYARTETEPRGEGGIKEGDREARTEETGKEE